MPETLLPATTPPASDAPDNITEFKVCVLLVDDQFIIAEAIRRMLASTPDIEFHYITDGANAREHARALRPTVILQDLVIPDTDGFQLIVSYREDETLRDVPVIVLSSKDDPMLKAHGFAVGANDYLVKLPDQLELVARIRYHSAAYISRMQRDQAYRYLRESQQALAKANIELQQLAALDGLTGIANRRRLDETMQIEWQRCQRSKTPLSLLLCDVDRFKLYNDSLGHQAGDLCLKKVAAVLTEQLKRPADLVARYGGEEFAILLPDTDMDGAVKLAEACRAQLERLMLEHPGTDSGLVTMSIGVASVAPSRHLTMEQLVGDADKAMYAAKNAGRNCVVTAED